MTDAQCVALMAARLSVAYAQGGIVPEPAAVTREALSLLTEAKRQVREAETATHHPYGVRCHRCGLLFVVERLVPGATQTCPECSADSSLAIPPIRNRRRKGECQSE